MGCRRELACGADLRPHSFRQETIGNYAHSAAIRVIESSGLSFDDIALLIPHQVNLRIVQSLAKSLGLPLEKFYINLDRYGNTSAASIPIALCEALEEGRLLLPLYSISDKWD